jgi:drug/metabolite transporter (DMT)-like permease
MAVATAMASILGFLYKYRGAVEAPAIEWRRPVHSSLVLFRSRWYVLGILIATASWGLHVAALSLAPISLVQTVIAGGLVLLTVLADRVFKLPVTRREWIGVGCTALGLALLAATLGGGARSAHSHYDEGTLLAYELAVAAGATVVGLASTRMRRPGLALAVSAGLFWAGSDVCIKALSGHLSSVGIGVLVHPLALAILVLSLVGLLVSAASLQAGPAVPVIAATSAAANVLTIAAGPIVFSDPLPDTPGGVALRALAFALIIVAAALTPGPVRVHAEPAR